MLSPYLSARFGVEFVAYEISTTPFFSMLGLTGLFACADPGVGLRLCLNQTITHITHTPAIKSPKPSDSLQRSVEHACGVSFEGEVLVEAARVAGTDVGAAG